MAFQWVCVDQWERRNINSLPGQWCIQIRLSKTSLSQYSLIIIQIIIRLIQILNRLNTILLKTYQINSRWLTEMPKKLVRNFRDPNMADLQRPGCKAWMMLIEQLVFEPIYQTNKLYNGTFVFHFLVVLMLPKPN